MGIFGKKTDDERWREEALATLPFLENFVDGFSVAAEAVEADVISGIPWRSTKPWPGQTAVYQASLRPIVGRPCRAIFQP